MNYMIRYVMCWMMQLIGDGQLCKNMPEEESLPNKYCITLCNQIKPYLSV